MASSRYTRSLCAALGVALATSVASAQFAPPTQDPVNTPDSAPAPAHAPSIVPDISFSAPPGGDTPGMISRDGLHAPVRGNTPMTTNALLGYINSTPVFALEVFLPIDEDLRRLARSARSIEDFRSSARTLIKGQVDQIKSEILIISAAEATFSEHDLHNVDAYLDMKRTELITSHGGSVPAANKALQAEGSSVELAMTDMRRKVIRDLYFAKNLGPKIVINRQMVLDAYAKLPAEPAQIELFQLTIPISRNLPSQETTDGTIGPPIKDPTPAQVQAAEAKTMAAANDIIAQLKKGPDTPDFFARMVEDNHSRDAAATRGGRTAGLKKGVLDDARLEQLAFSLPAHTLGQPLLLRDPDPSRTRVVIVKVGDKKDARTVPFAEAQVQIEKDLRDKQFQQLQLQHLVKLYNTGAIEALDSMVEVAVEAAVTRYATNG